MDFDAKIAETKRNAASARETMAGIKGEVIALLGDHLAAYYDSAVKDYLTKRTELMAELNESGRLSAVKAASAELADSAGEVAEELFSVSRLWSHEQPDDVLASVDRTNGNDPYGHGAYRSYSAQHVPKSFDEAYRRALGRVARLLVEHDVPLTGTFRNESDWEPKGDEYRYRYGGFDFPEAARVKLDSYGEQHGLLLDALQEERATIKAKATAEAESAWEHA